MIWLDYSRVFSIFAVILIHVSMGVVLLNDVGTEFWWVGNFYDAFSRWCVPVFVMVSGALLLDENKAGNISSFYRKRVKKILIPLVFWTVFYLLWYVLKGQVLGYEIISSDIFEKLTTGTPHYHMWYLYMIAGLYLFSPFISRAICGLNDKELLFIISILFLMSSLTYIYTSFFSSSTDLFITTFIYYLPYFIFGYYINNFKSNIKIRYAYVLFTLSGLLTMVGFYITSFMSISVGQMYFYGFLSITVIPMSVSVFYIFNNFKFRQSRLVSSLSSLTFGVYLIHPVFLEAINFLGFGVTNLHPMLSVPGVSLVVIFLSGFATYIIKKIPYLDRVC